MAQFDCVIFTYTQKESQQNQNIKIIVTVHMYTVLESDFIIGLLSFKNNISILLSSITYC